MQFFRRPTEPLPVIPPNDPDFAIVMSDYLLVGSLFKSVTARVNIIRPGTLNTNLGETSDIHKMEFLVATVKQNIRTAIQLTLSINSTDIEGLSFDILLRSLVTSQVNSSGTSERNGYLFRDITGEMLISMVEAIHESNEEIYIDDVEYQFVLRGYEQGHGGSKLVCPPCVKGK